MSMSLSRYGLMIVNALFPAFVLSHKMTSPLRDKVISIMGEIEAVLYTNRNGTIFSVSIWCDSMPHVAKQAYRRIALFARIK